MKYGIENIKKLLSFGFAFATELSSDLKDGKISFFEGLGMVTNIMQVPGIVKSWAAIKQELTDLDQTERHQLYDFIQNEFDIESDNIEVFVEKCLSWVISTVELIELRKTL